MSLSCDLVLTLHMLSFMPVGKGTKTLGRGCDESLTMFTLTLL